MRKLFTAHLNRTQRTDLMPDDVVLVVCDLMLGMPKSLEDSFVFTGELATLCLSSCADVPNVTVRRHHLALDRRGLASYTYTP